jgi:isopenicillin-N N-acyltransferase-like protein
VFVSRRAKGTTRGTCAALSALRATTTFWLTKAASSIRRSIQAFAILYAEDGIIVHTNHYRSKMQQIEYEPDELVGTRLRYFRAMRQLRRSPAHTIKTIQTIQRDHLNFPNSICNHSTDDIEPLDRVKTINAMIIDLTSRAMHITWGNPCENAYHTFHLEA